MIRKFCRNLFLRCLILAFTGDHAAEAFKGEPQQEVERSAAVAAMQALDQLGSGKGIVFLPVTAYEVIRGF